MPIGLPEPKKKRIGFITDDGRSGQTGSSADFIARDMQRPMTKPGAKAKPLKTADPSEN